MLSVWAEFGPFLAELAHTAIPVTFAERVASRRSALLWERHLGRRGTSLAGVSAGNDRIEGQQNCCRLRWQSRHPTAKGNSKWNRWPDVPEHSARVDATCLKKLSQRSAKVRHGACISNIADGFAAEVI